MLLITISDCVLVKADLKLGNVLLDLAHIALADLDCKNHKDVRALSSFNSHDLIFLFTVVNVVVKQICLPGGPKRPCFVPCSCILEPNFSGCTEQNSTIQTVLESQISPLNLV